MSGLGLAALPAVLQAQPGLLGDANRPGLQSLSRLVTDAEAALKADRLPLAQACLDNYFAESARYRDLSAKATPVDQFVCRAHFAAGQLVSKLSSSCKGQQLVDAVQEAVGHIMKGIELAATNPRYSHLVYNGSVHYWHAARPLQCDKLRHHLLHSQERVCQALEKVEGQAAWRVRHLLSLALCQLGEEGKPDEVNKTLAKALELTAAGNLQALRAEVLVLQTHHQTQLAARATAGKAGAQAGAGKAPGPAAAAPPAGAAATAKQGAAGGKRKPGDAAAVPGPGKIDMDGALAELQWVLSAHPDTPVAEQHLQTALKLVDTKPDKPGPTAQLQVVGRIGWAAAVSGAKHLAEQCACRAATSQDLSPRVWADLTRLFLRLQAAPEAALSASSCSSGTGAVLNPAALRARCEVLEGIDEAVSAFLKLGDVEGIHNCAVLAWNTGLPLLQPHHRGLAKPAFTAVAKALEAVGSPWTKLRAALHLEVGKAEADADSYIKAAREVSTALSLNYPSAADMAGACGYERPLDRYLEPMARAAQLRGVAPVQLDKGSGSPVDGAVKPDDDVVLLLERAKDSKSAPLRSEYLQKAINKLALLPAVLPPSGRAETEALQQQLRAARTRTQLWADIAELAWNPCQLQALVRSAVPFVLRADWQPSGDHEMLLLQARASFVGADAAKAALIKLGAEVVLPAGYTPCLLMQNDGGSSSTTTDVGSSGVVSSRVTSASRMKDSKAEKAGALVEELQCLVADYQLQGMRLAVAAGGNSWLVMNGALSAWNTYLPIMQRDCYADLAGVLLPVLQQLLKEPAGLEPNQLVMIAEAAAKAAEHTALLNFMSKPCPQIPLASTLSQPAAPSTPQTKQQPADGVLQSNTGSEKGLWVCRPSEQHHYKPLAGAQAATAGLDVVALLAELHDMRQLLSDTAVACEAALTRAAAASEPQGLIQAYTRLQQLQGKPITVPAGAPVSMADTSKLLAIIAGLTASAPAAGTPSAAPQPTATAPAGPTSGRLSSASTGKVPAGGAKAVPSVPVTSKVEQDIRTAMSLLSAMPSTNMQLWAQLARAAGWHGHWLLARECAAAALEALPAGKRDLAAVTVTADLPEVGAQGWYWLAVAEMQQGQGVLSLLSTAASTGAATCLSLRHCALQHFATATHLASFIRRPDLAESAARLAYNTAAASGGLMEAALTRAAAVPPLMKVATALNATRPTDVQFQLALNGLLLEALSAAGCWQEAKRHIEALHRSLRLSKQRGSAAAIDTLAGWRATCIVRASAGHALEEMPRLLSELSTPHAKARAWLAFAQATSSPAEQLSARQSALAALDRLPPTSKVEYQLEFAQWLATCPSLPHAAADLATPEQLLQAAAGSLEGAVADAQQTAAGIDGSTHRTNGSGGHGGLGAFPPPAADTSAAAMPISATFRDVSGHVCNVQHLDQLVRVYMLWSQVGAQTAARQQHLLQAQAYAQQLLTATLLAAGADVPASPVWEQTATTADSACSAGSGSAEAASVMPSCKLASTTTVDESKGQTAQTPGAVVPALQLPSRPATAATTTGGATVRSQAQATARGLVAGQQLPRTWLEWASWLPDEHLLSKLRNLAAAADGGDEDLVGNGSRPGSAAADSPAVMTAGMSASSTSASTNAAGGGLILSRSNMVAPELLLSNLDVLSQQLQVGGHHAAALPVLHLARLLALVTLDSQVMAAAVSLQLSSVCEVLQLTAAATDWLRLAALEQWPSTEQLQQAGQSAAVQQLAQQLLLEHRQSTDPAGTEDSSGRIAAAACGESTVFLNAAIQRASPDTIQSWLHASNSSSGSVDGNKTGSSSQGWQRPSSAAGAGAAAAALTTTVQGCKSGSVGILLCKPWRVLDSWVLMARYLVDHAQYTAGQRLCAVALQSACSCKDTAIQAEVLLLQARLALLAQQYEAAVHLAQAAQALGGSVQLWRDSVLCYAAARMHMPGIGPKDASEALEGGVALLAAVARGCGGCFQPRVLQATSCLKLQLARHRLESAQQQLAEAQEDPSCYGAAAQLHAAALALSREAAADAQQAGAVLLQVEALQLAAQLCMSHAHDSFAVRADPCMQHRRVSRPQSAQAEMPNAEDATKAAMELLQAAQQALDTVSCRGQAVQGTKLYAAGCSPQETLSAPLAQAMSAVLSQFSGAELLLSRMQLQQGRVSQAAVDPEFPRMEGRDPSAVIAFLNAGAAIADQASAGDHTSNLARAIQHSQEATEVAAAGQKPSLHAAALLAQGQAYKLQAHVAMLGQKDYLQQQSAGSTSDGCSQAGPFAAAWWPWPGPGCLHNEPTCADTVVSPAISQEGAAVDRTPAACLDCPPPPAAVVVEASPGAAAVVQSGVCADQAGWQLPSDVGEPYQQAIMHLQDALHEALQHQQLRTAERAARELLHCHGKLQPAKAALYLAVAQSCSSARAMKASFEQAAARQHPERLLWRQLQQLQASYEQDSVHTQQVHHHLSLLGITSKLLQVPQPDGLVAMLGQLPARQRLLLLHHNPEQQQLVLAAWGMPMAACNSQPAAATAAVAAGGGSPALASSPLTSSSGAPLSARGRRTSVKEAPQVPAAAATSGEPLPALLGSMPCTQQQLRQLAAAFAAYSRQLQRAILQATGEAVPAVVLPAEAVVPGAAAAAGAKKPPASAVGKAGGKDKALKEAAAAEVPPWVPPKPVLPSELNTQWRQLMQQFEAFLQPLSSLLANALQQPTQVPVEPPAAAVKPGSKVTSSNGAKPVAAAALAPAQLALQLLLDPVLCDLPWEALPVVRRSCGSVARCFSLAQLQQLLQPRQLLGQRGLGLADAAGAAGSFAAAPPVTLDLSRLSYLVDPMHHMSSTLEHPRCYAAPLLPCFRQQMQEVWGRDWEGYAGVECQLPSAEQLVRPMQGCSGLLVLVPGRLLTHAAAQAVAALDLSSCTAALLFDRLENAAAAVHQTNADNRKTEAERALGRPDQTALLLLLRGMRSVALTTLPGTPHTHVQLATNVLRALSSQPLQQLQGPSWPNSDSGSSSTAAVAPGASGRGAPAGAGGGGEGDFSLLPVGPQSSHMNLAEAVLAAQRQGLAGFELQALAEAGMVVYGLAGVMAAEGCSSKAAKVPRKG